MEVLYSRCHQIISVGGVFHSESSKAVSHAVNKVDKRAKRRNDANKIMLMTFHANTPTMHRIYCTFVVLSFSGIYNFCLIFPGGKEFSVIKRLILDELHLMKSGVNFSIIRALTSYVLESNAAHARTPIFLGSFPFSAP